MKLLLILLHILLFILPYTASQVNYFINCGSSDTVTLPDNRTFVGDVKPHEFHLYSKNSKTVKKSDSSDISSLYTSARVFGKSSSYVFDITQTGTYMIRFHFFAFSSTPSLSEAIFDVSASGKMLLPGFSIGKNDTDSVIKEFIVSINSAGDFRVHFTPALSIAFVNAIELFPAGLNITKGVILNSNNILEKIYRINVGIGEVNSTNDKFWRDWVTDDQFLVNNSDAQNSTIYSGGIKYGSVIGAATVEDAPEQVYETTKMLKSNSQSNLTWKFDVSKGASHLIRLHFCDITPFFGNYMMDLSIDGNFVQKVDPFNITSTQENAVPFFTDHVIDTGNAESIEISLGLVNASYLFLNGVEIMQITNGTAPDDIEHDSSSSSHTKLIIALVVPFVILIIVCIILAVFCVKKKNVITEESDDWEMIPMYGAISTNRSSERSPSSQASNLRNLNLGLKIPFRYIKKVTNNFDEALIIGEGGFGKVYKAEFKNGVKVAVKRSSPDHGQGLAEFHTEIMVLSRIRHRHLVSLIGYCYEDNEMILVYEFMEKGTLREYLYDSPGLVFSSGLTWKQRVEICCGAAKGLHYLHTGLDGGIIHRDVKSTNILLDNNYVAKVADFGLSKLRHSEQHTVHTDVKGTLGYLDPEYFLCMQLTEKSDVYSFGVVLLEVISGKPVFIQSKRSTLVDWVMSCVEQGKVEEIVDPVIIGEVTESGMKKFVEIAYKCLNENAVERPAMSDVVWDLEYILQLQRGVVGNTMTDSSLNLPVPGDPMFSFTSFSNVGSDVTITNVGEVGSDVTITTTGEVFSQLNLDRDDTGR